MKFILLLDEKPLVSDHREPLRLFIPKNSIYIKKWTAFCRDCPTVTGGSQNRHSIQDKDSK
jgi:hypothetical protein